MHVFSWNKCKKKCQTLHLRSVSSSTSKCAEKIAANGIGSSLLKIPSIQQFNKQRATNPHKCFATSGAILQPGWRAAKADGDEAYRGGFVDRWFASARSINLGNALTKTLLLCATRNKGSANKKKSPNQSVKLIGPETRKTAQNTRRVMKKSIILNPLVREQ